MINITGGPLDIKALMKDRTLWAKIALRCKRCGWVFTLENLANRTVRQQKTAPKDHVLVVCPNCRMAEHVFDPGVAMLLKVN